MLGTKADRTLKIFGSRSSRSYFHCLNLLRFSTRIIVAERRKTSISQECVQEPLSPANCLCLHLHQRSRSRLFRCARESSSPRTLHFLLLLHCLRLASVQVQTMPWWSLGALEYLSVTSTVPSHHLNLRKARGLRSLLHLARCTVDAEVGIARANQISSFLSRYGISATLTLQCRTMSGHLLGRRPCPREMGFNSSLKSSNICMLHTHTKPKRMTGSSTRRTQKKYISIAAASSLSYTSA